MAVQVVARCPQMPDAAELGHMTDRHHHTYELPAHVAESDHMTDRHHHMRFLWMYLIWIT